MQSASNSNTSLRNAGKDLRICFTFKDPTLGKHQVKDGQTRRVAMIGRAAHAIVVQSVERFSSFGAETVAGAESGRYLDIERDGFVLPGGFGLDDRALIRERCIEVRTPGGKRRAEKAACRRGASKWLLPDIECEPSALPRAPERAGV